MKRVKEFLDKYFEPSDLASTIEEKKDGHYCVHGSWAFRRGNTDITYSEEGVPIWTEDFTTISLNINNETILFMLQMVNGKNVGKYSNLQTYGHIPRGEPDENGYYRRSTEDEVIKYIFNMIGGFIRDEKLEDLLNISD